MAKLLNYLGYDIVVNDAPWMNSDTEIRSDGKVRLTWRFEAKDEVNDVPTCQKIFEIKIIRLVDEKQELQEFPEPVDDVFIIVSEEVASAIKNSGRRPTDDLLIPYWPDEDGCHAVTGWQQI